MPVTLKTGVMKYRKSDGTYSVMDALMQEPAQDQIDAIETAGQEQVDAIEQKGQDILDSLPEDYTELETDVGELKSAINDMTTATAEDVGKALKAKTVIDGKVTEWEFGIVGSPTDSALSLTSTNPVQNKIITGALGDYATLSEYGANITEILAWIIDAVENPINPNWVDVCLFAGQSNMDGRGTAADAPAVAQGTAYKWDKDSQQVVDFSSEGSLIPAYVKEYYQLAKVPIVEVKKAVGGADISGYITNFLSDAIEQLDDCISYLGAHGKIVRRVFMLWNQGENDVDYTGLTALSTEQYMAYFATLKSSVMSAGVQKIFIINIGQNSNGAGDFSKIRMALESVCDGEDVIEVSDKFFGAQYYMSDMWHYTQTVYNVVGKNAAENTVYYYRTGEEPTIDRFHEYGDALPIPAAWVDLDPAEWTYTLDLQHAKITLNSYIGSDPEVNVAAWYRYDGDYYATLIKLQSGASNPGTFVGNTTITDLAFDDGVLYGNGTAGQQKGSYICSGMSNLETVENFPVGSAGMAYAFEGTAKLVQAMDVTGCSGDFTHCFDGSGIISCGDISGATAINYCFQNCSNLVDVGNITGTFTQFSAVFTGCAALKTVGNITAANLGNVSQVFKGRTTLEKVGDISTGSTSMNSWFQGCTALKTVGKMLSTGLTQITNLFLNCTSLEGEVYFASADISFASNAFTNCDLTKITIKCPANSTTYTTLSTLYPTANIVTF